METSTDEPEHGKLFKIMKTITGKPVFYKLLLILFGYIISHLQVSFLLIAIFAITWIYLDRSDKKISNKIKAKAIAYNYHINELAERINEIPAWVKFPDKERAEWINQIIEQLWPTLDSYVIKLFRTSLQSKIRKKYDSFRFENIDFGRTPPKIEGVKVYSEVKDSVIIDFDLFYDGDCDVNFSISGAEMGGIKDFQLSAEARLILKPLLQKAPILGGLQLFFLNPPNINFTLDGLSAIPGLSTFLRTKLEEKISKKLVFPNKITKRFSKSVAPSELKALEPAGVLRVHVFEAKDLEGKDFTGKSDPYVVLYVGVQERKTKPVYQNLNPKWDHWCEFVIVDPMVQYVGFQIYDKDNVNEDDFLGSGEVDINTVLKGQTDQWVKLQKAKRGTIHLRFTWFSLSDNLDDLETIKSENRLLKVTSLSSALLTVYVDSAINLPLSKHSLKPHPYFTLSLGEQKEKSRAKKHTNAPSWEQGFVLLVGDPLLDTLQMIVTDKSSGNILGQLSYKIDELLKQESFGVITKGHFDLGVEGRVLMSLQLKILNKSSYEVESEESESSDSDEGSNRMVEDEKADSKNIREDIMLKSPNVSSTSQAPKIVRLNSAGEHNLGRLELSFAYNEPRQKLLITVHKVSNLPLKDPSDVPDPYVRLRMSSHQKHSAASTNRTKIVSDSCNPTFEETFEYCFSRADVADLTLLATVKSKKFFNNDNMGEAEILIKYLSLTEPYRAWFDLAPKKD